MSVRVSPPSLDGPATQPTIRICYGLAFHGDGSVAGARQRAETLFYFLDRYLAYPSCARADRLALAMRRFRMRANPKSFVPSIIRCLRRWWARGRPRA